MFTGHGVTQLIAKAHGDEEEVRRRDDKSKRPPMVFWREEEGKIWRGQFCKLSGFWYWNPVASCGCDTTALTASFSWAPPPRVACARRRERGGRDDDEMEGLLIGNEDDYDKDVDVTETPNPWRSASCV